MDFYHTIRRGTTKLNIYFLDFEFVKNILYIKVYSSLHITFLSFFNCVFFLYLSHAWDFCLEFYPDLGQKMAFLGINPTHGMFFDEIYHRRWDRKLHFWASIPRMGCFLAKSTTGGGIFLAFFSFFLIFV